jgi:hypothetical protein
MQMLLGQLVKRSQQHVMAYEARQQQHCRLITTGDSDSHCRLACQAKRGATGCKAWSPVMISYTAPPAAHHACVAYTCCTKGVTPALYYDTAGTAATAAATAAAATAAAATAAN